MPAKPSASNPQANKRIANPQAIGSTVDTVCPEETPFFDGRICINCEKPAFFFNETSLECYVPPSNYSNPSAINRFVNGSALLVPLPIHDPIIDI